MSSNISIDSIDAHGTCDGLLASSVGLKQALAVCILNFYLKNFVFYLFFIYFLKY